MVLKKPTETLNQSLRNKYFKQPTKKCTNLLESSRVSSLTSLSCASANDESPNITPQLEPNRVKNNNVFYRF